MAIALASQKTTCYISTDEMDSGVGLRVEAITSMNGLGILVWLCQCIFSSPTGKKTAAISLCR